MNIGELYHYILNKQLNGLLGPLLGEKEGFPRSWPSHKHQAQTDEFSAIYFPKDIK